jgi:hypothetical protein
MFNNDNIWIGGMSMSMGKTVGLSIPKKNYVSPFTTTPAPFTTTPSPFTTTPAPFTTTPAPFTTTEIPEIQETEMPEIQEFPEIEELNYQENFSIPFMSMTSTIKPSDYNAGPITGPYGI